MRVLVACEFSGRVRDAFRKEGHDAYSVDLLPTEEPGPHIQGNVLDMLSPTWDLMVAFPPCQYLCKANGNKRIGSAEEAAALDFVRTLMAAPIERIAIENPPGRIGTQIRPADQYVHPWWFGDPFTKQTGLWLKGLPLLRKTNPVPYWGTHEAHYMRPRKDRWKERSRTFYGLATAMAQQWGTLDLERPHRS